MPKRPRVTQAKLDELRKAYEDWNPYAPDETRSAADLAAEYGMSKNTMYTWRGRGWQLDGAKLERGRGSKSPAETDLDPVVRFLTGELVEARVEIERLRAEIAKLRAEPEL